MENESIKKKRPIPTKMKIANRNKTISNTH